MNEKLRTFLTTAKNRLLDLPPVYFYVGLATICAVLFLSSWFGEEEKAVVVETQISLAGRTPTPEPVVKRPDLFATMESDAGGETKTLNELRSSINGLEEYIESIIGKKSFATPRWLNFQFAGAGIDRARFKPRYSDDQIAVKRWQASPQAPVFRNGKDAGDNFDQFVKNSLVSWLDSTDFRIDLKLYQTEFDGDTVTAQLVAEAFGQSAVDQTSRGGTAKGAGVQSTSIWKTTWLKVNNKLELKNIQVQAQEEIAANISGGQLFKDCTASILKRCKSLPNQLIYGLDQWSRQIPGIDIVGNHGVAVGDINKDGLDDLYICQPHGLPNVLLIQNPDGTAENFAKSAGLDVLDETHAALMVDIDNDHDQDMILSTDENLILLSNDGNGKFQLEHRLPIGRDAHSISAADFDRDGDLDLFLCKYKAINRQNEVLLLPRNLETGDDGGRNILLRNDEGWKFEDATEQCGITSDNTYFSRSAVWTDYDFDGDSDLYIANEFAADQLYENQDGWFSDISKSVGLKAAARHRSVSVGDFNQDGRFDFFVATDTPLSAIREFKNSKEPKSKFKNGLTGENQIWFSSKPGEQLVPFYLRAPIFSSESAFGSVTADLNNDGLDDVVVTNGFLTRSSSQNVDELFYKSAFNQTTNGQTTNDEANSVARSAHDVAELCRSGYSFGSSQRNRCYLSIGKLGFANFSAVSGIDLPDDARGVAATDWDNDGDPDLVMTCRNGPQIRIFRNQLDSNNRFVHFNLIGTESNRDAIGARIELNVEGRAAPLVKMVQAGSGNLSQSTKRVMFGLGKSEKINQVSVFWPSGKKQTFNNVSVDTRYELVEGAANLKEKTNERFDLQLPSRLLEGETSLPLPKTRTVFYPPMPMPKIQFQSGAKQWHDVRPGEDKPLLAVFYSRNAASEKALQSFKGKSETLGDINCVGVLLGQSKSESSNFDTATELAEKNGFTYPAGSATANSIDKLSLLNGEWFNDLQVPTTPFALLLDSQGNACAHYSAESFDLDTVIEDLLFIETGEASYSAKASPLGGRWIAQYRTPKLNSLKMRLAEIGYEEDAKYIASKSLPRGAYELCQKAIELESQGEYVPSRGFFNRAISVDPSCVSAYVGRGELLRKMSNEQIIGDDSARAPLQEQASSDFEKAIELDALNTDAIIGRANIAIDQNRISDALVQLTEYLQVDPDRFEVHAIIGRLLFFQKRYPEAAKFLVAAFENRPTLPFVAGDLGFLYLSAGEYKNARKFLELAHRLQPSDKNMLRLLAEAEFITGRFEEAVGLFQQVTELEPSRRRAKNVLAWLLATCPYEDHRNGERAMAIMNPMVELVGEASPSTLEIYAACFAELGDFKKALELQEKAVTLMNSNNTLESYSDEQMNGMRSRVELYRRQRPYRMANLAQIPISPPGRK